MELFWTSLVSYWLGFLVYRGIYTRRLRTLRAAQQAVMDQVYAQTQDPTWLTFCSDITIMEQARNGLRVAERLMQQRGLTHSKEI